jgi:hypothetical protein
MSKQLFSLEYSLPNTVLPRRAQKDRYRGRVAQIQSNGGPAMIRGDPEAEPAAAGAAVLAEASTALFFCYTEKFNHPRQIIDAAGWQTTRFINQDEQYSAPAGAAGAAAQGAPQAAAGAPAGAAVRNDVIVKWQTGTFASKMNYERPKNVFVLEGMKDFGGSRGDVDLLGSVEDHDKLIIEIKKLFPNGANLAQPHPDEVCDEWLTTPPNASDTFWGNEIKKKGIEKGKDEKVLEAAKGTDFDPEMLRIIKYLHTEGIRKFLFDAGIKKIGANAPINIHQGVSIDPKKDFYYTASFDAAPEIAGYGVGIFKQPPLAPIDAPNELLERSIKQWVEQNIIIPLQTAPVAAPAAAPKALEGYFIQPGLDCDKGYLFEISVYTKKALDNLQKIREIYDEILERQIQYLEIVKDKMANAEMRILENEASAASNNKPTNNIKQLRRNLDIAIMISNEASELLQKINDDYSKLDQKAIELGNKLSILRYLVFLPKDSRQNAVISISIPSQDYELSITQARYNYKSFQHPDEAIKILPFNDCKFYQKIKDSLSDTEKAAFCVLQKWNCDQNDAILNALVRDSCLLSVDKPAIAATIARGGNAFLFGDKSGNGIYKNKKFYKITSFAGAEDNNYKIFPQRDEPAEQAEIEQRKQRRKDAAEAAVVSAAEPARALAGRVSAATTAAEAAAARAEARAARGAARAAQAAAQAARAAPAAPMNVRRHRYSRKPNKPRRRSTRKHKN